MCYVVVLYRTRLGEGKGCKALPMLEQRQMAKDFEIRSICSQLHDEPGALTASGDLL